MVLQLQATIASNSVQWIQCYKNNSTKKYLQFIRLLLFCILFCEHCCEQDFNATVLVRVVIYVVLCKRIWYTGMLELGGGAEAHQGPLLILNRHFF